MLDNKVTNMSPGEALLDVPMGEMIQKLAVSISEAQLKLDQTAIRVASLLSETKVDFSKEDGTTISKSLLELGFEPKFYQFTEAEIEVKMTLSMKIEEAFDVSGGLSAGNASPAGGANSGGTTDSAKAKPAKDNRVVPWGAAINVEYHRKYEFDVGGSSMIKTKLISMPAPSVFLDTIKEHARSGGTING